MDRVKAVNLATTNIEIASKRLTEVKMYTELILSGKMTLNYTNKANVLHHLTLLDLMQQYMQFRKKDIYRPLRASTLKLMQDHLNAWIDHFGGNTTAIVMNQNNFDDYFQSLAKQGLSPNYVNLRIRTLAAFWRWANNKYEWLKLMTFHQLPVQFKYKYINDSDFQKILNNSPSDFLKSVWKLMMETGCRRSEPLIGYIDGQFLIVPGKIAKVTGKDRVIALKPEHIPVIQKMQRLHHGPSYYTRKFKEACRAAGVNGYLHCLRSSYAVRTTLLTGNIHLTSQLLGHSSVITTESYACMDMRKIQQDFPSIFNENIRSNSK